MTTVGRGRRSFWWITLATAAVVATGVALGLWQLRRAEQKLALAAQIARQGELAPLSNGALRAEPASLWHRRALVRGSWVPGATVFLDNRQMAGRPGFFVLTPLRLQGSGDVLLVQRGWVPRDQRDRTLLPGAPKRLAPCVPGTSQKIRPTSGIKASSAAQPDQSMSWQRWMVSKAPKTSTTP